MSCAAVCIALASRTYRPMVVVWLCLNIGREGMATKLSNVLRERNAIHWHLLQPSCLAYFVCRRLRRWFATRANCRSRARASALECGHCKDPQDARFLNLTTSILNLPTVRPPSSQHQQTIRYHIDHDVDHETSSLKPSSRCCEGIPLRFRPTLHRLHSQASADGRIKNITTMLP